VKIPTAARPGDRLTPSVMPLDGSAEGMFVPAVNGFSIPRTDPLICFHLETLL